MSRTLLLITLLATCLPGCDPGQSQMPDIRGTVTEVRHAKIGSRDKVLGSVLIKSIEQPAVQANQTSVLVTADTRLFSVRGKEREAIKFIILTQGQRVEAWFAGPVLQSYPPQATAAEIILRDP